MEKHQGDEGLKEDDDIEDFLSRVRVPKYSKGLLKSASISMVKMCRPIGSHIDQ
jgi:hypothetical protein